MQFLDRSASFTERPDWPRLAGVGLLLVGIAHLVAPRVLLRTAATGYDLVLDVSFSPGTASPQRVRLIGLCMIAAGAHLLYHGGVVPDSGDR